MKKMQKLKKQEKFKKQITKRGKKKAFYFDVELIHPEKPRNNSIFEL